MEVLKQSRFQIEVQQSLRSRGPDDTPCLESIHWRFDVQTHSKAFSNQCLPKIYLKISTDREAQYLESDYANLANLEKSISAALSLSEVRDDK